MIKRNGVSSTLESVSRQDLLHCTDVSHTDRDPSPVGMHVFDGENVRGFVLA